MPLSRGWIRSLERRAGRRLGFFELLGGERYYFDPGRAHAALFVFTYNAAIGEESAVPEVLRKVAEARDVRGALARVGAGEDTLAEVLDLDVLVRERRIVLLDQAPAEDLSTP